MEISDKKCAFCRAKHRTIPLEEQFCTPKFDACCFPALDRHTVDKIILILTSFTL